MWQFVCYYPIVLLPLISHAEGKGVHRFEQSKILKGIIDRIPLGHWGEPDDIAKAVLFFASAASDYVTGTLLFVDGGFLLS